MVIMDKHGKEIIKGSYIIYTKTGTKGEVIDTKTDEHGSWALIQYGELDKLWYNSKFIEITDIKKNNNLDNENDTEHSVTDLKEKLNNVSYSGMSEDAVGGG